MHQEFIQRFPLRLFHPLISSRNFRDFFRGYAPRTTLRILSETFFQGFPSGIFLRNSTGDLKKFLRGFSQTIYPEIFSRNFFGDLHQEFLRRFPLGISRIPPGISSKNSSGIYLISSRSSSGDFVQKFLRAFLQELFRGFPPVAPPAISFKNSFGNCSGDFLQKFSCGFARGIPPGFHTEIPQRIFFLSSGNLLQKFLR